MSIDIDNLNARIQAIQRVLQDQALSDTKRVNDIHAIMGAFFANGELTNILPGHILRQLSDNANNV